MAFAQRAGRVLQRWAARFSLQHSTKIILWCIARLLISVHWFACIFALQASLHSSVDETWLSGGFYDYCPDSEMWHSVSNLTGDSSGEVAVFCDGLSTFEVYIAAFTWSLMVITGTGGTDFYPSHKSFAETIVVICLLFTGAILWTQILADFCNVATNGDPAGVKFQQTLDDMNSFIQLTNIPPELQLRIREYMIAQQYIREHTSGAADQTPACSPSHPTRCSCERGAEPSIVYFRSLTPRDETRDVQVDLSALTVAAGGRDHVRAISMVEARADCAELVCVGYHLPTTHFASHEWQVRPQALVPNHLLPAECGQGRLCADCIEIERRCDGSWRAHWPPEPLRHRKWDCALWGQSARFRQDLRGRRYHSHPRVAEVRVP